MNSKTIKTLRKSVKMTQQDLADALNISISTVSKWECGVVKPSRMAKDKLEAFIDGVRTARSVMGKFRNSFLNRNK